MSFWTKIKEIHIALRATSALSEEIRCGGIYAEILFCINAKASDGIYAETGEGDCLKI